MYKYKTIALYFSTFPTETIAIIRILQKFWRILTGKSRCPQLLCNLAYWYGYYTSLETELKSRSETYQLFPLKKAINDAGSAENIKVWCYPTPQQRLIFSEPKLILLGAWGTGKTLFMIAESIRLAEMGQKVLFLLFSSKEQNSGSKKVGFFC